MINKLNLIFLSQLNLTHKYLEQMMGEVTEEVVQFQPPGTANPIAGTYAHLVFTEDYVINKMLQNKAPLFETSWKDMTGASELQPADWVNEYPKWLRRVKLQLAEFRKYTLAVFENSEIYIKSLSDDDFSRMVKAEWGGNDRSVAEILGMTVIAHANNIMGEISVLKGIQGLKGYPF
jgi:hypothetical protein